MRSLDHLKIKLFVDAADPASIESWCCDPRIAGLTTNPTLMRKAGVDNFEEFSRQALKIAAHLPVSIEVIADELAEMEAQARRIATWGSNAYVKIPVTNTQGVSTNPLIRRLSMDGIKVNVTAILSDQQVREVCEALDPQTPSVVSVFAGRIADTGVDPVPVMQRSLTYLRDLPQAELLWASPRELLNVFQADAIGVHIITAVPEILKKLGIIGRDLEEYSLETVRMFYEDAVAAGYKI